MFKNVIRHCWLLIAAAVAVPLPNSYAFAPPQKKLIEAGWDQISSADLLKYQEEIEKAPYDGIVLALTTHDDSGKLVELKNRVFSSQPLELKWFNQNVEELKRFKSDKLTDNFAIITNRNTADWFDDGAWEQIIKNWKTAAIIAKKGGLKGLCLDPENYSGNEPYTYSSRPYADKYSFDEYQEKVRQRGREVIDAITSIYPDMVFFTFRMHDINHRYVNGGLEGASYGLYPAFIDGWLDAAPSMMTFVDGGENAYTHSEPEQFYRQANAIRNTSLALVSPENRQKYRALVQVSFGLYLDAYSYYELDSPNARDRRYALKPLRGSRLNRLQSNVMAAVDAADEYVWTWGEHYRWWSTDSLKAKNSDMSSKTWEQVLPGTTKVLLEAVQPKTRQLEQRKQDIRMLRNTEIPRIDGRLDDAIYHKHAWTPSFVPFLAEYHAINNQTTAFLARDDQNLYIAVRCVESEMENQHVVGDSHDSDIWGGESVEIAILKPNEKADSPKSSFYHFIINPANVRWDSIDAAGKSDKSYAPTWESATAKTKDGWTAEMKIPFREIGINNPRLGLTIHANLARKRDASYTELSSWSQFIGGFREPHNFGTWTLR